LIINGQSENDGWLDGWMGLDWIGLDWIDWMDGFFFHPLLDDNSITNTNWEQIATLSTQVRTKRCHVIERLRSFFYDFWKTWVLGFRV